MGKLSNSSPSARMDSSDQALSPRFSARILGIPQLVGALVVFVFLIVGWNFLGQFYLTLSNPMPLLGGRL